MTELDTITAILDRLGVQYDLRQERTSGIFELYTSIQENPELNCGAGDGEVAFQFDPQGDLIKLGAL